MKNRRTAVAILLASFTVAAAAVLAFLAVRHLGGGYSEGALKEQMTADINEFIRRFEVPQGDLDAVQGLYDSGVSEELADLSAQTLTKPGVNYEGYEKFRDVAEVYAYFDRKVQPQVVERNIENERCASCEHAALRRCCGGCPAFAPPAKQKGSA